MQVATGPGFAVALLANGTVVAWGDNSFGQLGDGTQVDHARPTRVAVLSGVRPKTCSVVSTPALVIR